MAVFHNSLQTAGIALVAGAVRRLLTGHFLRLLHRGGPPFCPPPPPRGRPPPPFSELQLAQRQEGASWHRRVAEVIRETARLLSRLSRGYDAAVLAAVVVRFVGGGLPRELATMAEKFLAARGAAGRPLTAGWVVQRLQRASRRKDRTFLPESQGASDAKHEELVMRVLAIPVAEAALEKFLMPWNDKPVMLAEPEVQIHQGQARELNTVAAFGVQIVDLFAAHCAAETLWLRFFRRRVCDSGGAAEDLGLSRWQCITLNAPGLPWRKEVFALLTFVQYRRGGGD